MHESIPNRRWASLHVPLAHFQQRMNQQPTSSLLSRLALIHQVAKAYALDDLNLSGASLPDLAIEEITDPPMYDLDIEDGVVIIQYSYALP